MTGSHGAAPQRPSKQRQTKQRTAVLEALAEGSEFRSAQSWHEHLRAQGSTIGLATVYRTLQSLAEGHEADTVLSDDGETLYRQCGSGEGHHHHLRCRRCGAAEDIAGPGVEEWASRIAAEHGYAQIEHTIELTGICAECHAEEHK